MTTISCTLQKVLFAFCLGMVSQVSTYAQSPAPLTEKKTQQADQQFTLLKAHFLKALWVADPDTAMGAGKFDHAAKLAIPNQQSRDAYFAFLQKWLLAFERIKEDQLSVNEQTDFALIRNYLRSNQWYLKTFREFEWNPTQYNIGGSFDAILNTDFAPKRQRVKIAIARLEGVPAFYAAAKASIRQPTLEHTRLAVQQSAGALAVLDDLAKAVQDQGVNGHERQVFDTRLRLAKAAITDFSAWLGALEKSLTPSTARSFRIGKDLYGAKFAHDIQSSLTAEQAYQRALVAKDDALQNMEKLADQLWPSVMAGVAKPDQPNKKIAMVIEKLSTNHVEASQFINEIRRQIPVLENWIREHDLLSLDPKKPLVVRETPVYQRGVSVASIEAPGVFRPQDQTYYNVSPLDGLPPERVESTLREYNHWVLQILNIHEAIPGHYAQLQHANQSPSVIKALFGNGAMVEGWAVYSERMMLESGYGNNAPEMWLMYYKWNLRTICNTILDYSVHVLGMSEAEAKDFLVNQAFQTQAEANGKWLRVQYTSVQLTSYFSGYSEILAFREQLKQEQGAAFNLKQFHEKFLSYGSAPVGIIKKLMTKS